ncbi:MAG: T9SS type A sorting domain-containing protein [Flavobacteriaceae bacterium]|nr:T9SS type A sorting domain-containing protein [Flavobacteriaceae bacterium]
MKQFYLLLALCVATVSMTAQNTVTADASATFNGFANVFETPANGGAFVFGSPWGVPDLKTVVDPGAGTITLQPNFNTYADNPNDPFWVDQTTGEGNKIFEGNTYVEDNSLVGSELTFNGGVVSYTLDPAYVAMAFIKVFNSDFSVVKTETTPMVAGENFSVTYTNVETSDAVVQYGWFVSGRNANPADEATLGSIVITDNVLSVNENNTIHVTSYPNPVNDVWNIQTQEIMTNVSINNMLGQKVISTNPNATSITIETSALVSGIYTATISTESGSKSIKIIKK